VRARSVAPAWIGGNDLGTEGTWRWADNDQAQFWSGRGNGAPVGGAYSHWINSNPDELGSGEDCAVRRKTEDGWWDQPCSTRLDYVCEAFLCTANADCGTGQHCAADHQCRTCEVSDTTCDTIDQDCSGVADEDYVSESTTCGVGACANAGGTTCVDGEVVDECTISPPLASMDATCDGIDDNCNGVNDEGCADTMSAPKNGMTGFIGNNVFLFSGKVSEDQADVGLQIQDQVTGDWLDMDSILDSIDGGTTESDGSTWHAFSEAVVPPFARESANFWTLTGTGVDTRVSANLRGFNTTTGQCEPAPPHPCEYTIARKGAWTQHLQVPPTAESSRRRPPLSCRCRPGRSARRRFC
jgi:hypothetical protein